MIFKIGPCINLHKIRAKKIISYFTISLHHKEQRVFKATFTQYNTYNKYHFYDAIMLVHKG